MFPIADLNKVDIVFGVDTDSLMPTYAEIPKQHKYGINKAYKFISTWFYSGLKDQTFTPRDGVDVRKALLHIQAILNSFKPKHEHKIAACAYLLDEWFSSYEE